MTNQVRRILCREASPLKAAMSYAIAGALILILSALSIPASRAQRTASQAGPSVRITGDISAGGRTRLAGTLHPMTKHASDAGAVPAGTPLHGISMVFKRSAVQDADLKALMKAQQDAASPLYHQWLTPDQFGARFGMAQPDLDKASVWLEQQGFAIERVSRSRDRIYFSGTVGQVNAAFSTALHYYTVEGTRHFAPSTEISVPTALLGVVRNIGNLDSFRPRGMHQKVNPDLKANPDFTSGVSGHHYLSPGDVATIYDINAAYQAGWNGDAQGIAIVGQSDIVASDIEHFQTAAGFTTPKDAVKVLVPATGNSGNFNQGDEGESDLDLEWSSTVAPRSTEYFVFTGDGGNANVFDSIVFAIDTRIAPIITVSYGACEIAIGSAANVQSLEDAYQQSAVQGQTLLAASGDDGGSGCFRDTNLSASDRTALSISYPASSPYFTGVGGTQFNEGSGNYWNDTPGTDIVASALSYIPEVVWNEDSATRGLGSSGGGVSIFFTKPDWQVGVPGIPADGMRDSPDIALASAGGHDGLIFCTSDSAFWAQGQQASCDNGFRDNASSAINVAGGTSFASPIFAGMLAIINQQQNSTGQGVINGKLYTLASSPSTYASAFHDITGGDNKCDTGETSFCPNGATGYAATTGYDQATGLGTVDFYNLLTSWGSPSLIGTRTALTVVTQSPSTTSPVAIGIQVAAVSGSALPTGTVTMTIDGATDATPVALDNGAATYNATISGSGAHVIVATYSGDSTYAASTSTITFSTLFETSIIIDVSSPTPIVGSTATLTAHVEPTSGFNYPTGAVTFSMDGTTISYPQTLASGATTFPIQLKHPGKHTFSAAYSGDINFAASTGSTSVNVVKGTSMTVIASSGTPMIGSPDNITVSVLPTSGTDVPSGSLRVVVNGQVVSPAPVLDATGTATFPVVFSAVGSQPVTVSYAGSSDFAAASGAVSVIAMPAATITSITAANTTPLLKADDVFTITVAATVGNIAPDGTVTITVDGAAVATPLVLLNGVATYDASFITTGAHTISAAYSGGTSTVASSGAVTVTVPAPAFTLATSALTLPQKGSGTAIITVTPANGYTGTIAFSVATSGLTNVCYSMPSVTLDGSGPVTASLKLTASEQSCPSTGTSALALAEREAPGSTGKKALGGSTIAVAGMLLGIFGRRRRWQQGVLVFLVLLGMGAFATGCGGSSSHSTPKGNYTVTVTGTDTTTQTATSTVSIAVTVN